MAYAELEDLKSRAGVLAEAWDDEGTDVGDADLERFLDTSAAEIDAALAGIGLEAPITDELAARSLVGYNADKALLLAIPATWPGGSGPEEVRDLVGAVKDRVKAYDAALESGKLSAVVMLEQQGAEGGSSNFWEQETLYDYVARWEESKLVMAPSVAPGAHKWARF